MKNSLESDQLLEEFLKKIEQWKAVDFNKEVDSKGNSSLLHFQIMELFSQEIYEYTKKFLDDNAEQLSPEAKGQVLSSYIDLWSLHKCRLELSNTSYLNKSGHPNNYFAPMLAGFNLQNACLKSLYRQNLFFLHVNLKNSDFSKTFLPFSIFVCCDLSDIKTGRTNLNQSKYYKCDLQRSNLLGARLDGGAFDACDLRQARLTEEQKKLWHYDCVLEEPSVQEIKPSQNDDSDSENKGKRPKLLTSSTHCSAFNTIFLKPANNSNQDSSAPVVKI